MDKSFFDQNDQSFWTTKKQTNVYYPLKEGQFYVPGRSMNKNDLITLKLSGKCLIMKDGNMEIYADIENARLTKLENSGISLVKSQVEFQFFGEIDEFYVKLKHFCIQNDFFSKYHFLSLVGEGSYAKVYKARNKLNLVENAIKVFDKSLLIQPTDKPALLKELSILRQLSHSNILQLNEVFETKTNIYLILEYYAGGDLNHYVKKQCLSEEQAKPIMTEFLSALLYMHSKGIFHRDIKPQNILLRKKNQITDLIIADFGLADYYRKDGKYMFTRCGTPGYVAPEILQDLPYDFKVDVYSIGVVLFVMLTGQPLFKGDSEPDIVKLNMDNHFDFTGCRLSPQCQDLLHGMLDSNPLSRFSITQCKQHRWFAQETPPPVSIKFSSISSKLQFPLDFNSEDNSPCSPKKTRKFQIKSNVLTPRLSGSSTSSFERPLPKSTICKTEPSEPIHQMSRLKLAKHRFSTKKFDNH